MNGNDKLFEEIEDYLAGNLSSEAKKAFEDALGHNEDIQTQVAFSKLTNELVTENRLLAIKELASKTHQEEQIKGNWKKGGIILSAIVAVGVSGYFLLPKDAENSDQKTVSAQTNAAEKKHVTDTSQNTVAVKTEEKKTILHETKKEETMEPTEIQTNKMFEDKSELENKNTEIESKQISSDKQLVITKAIPCEGIKLNATIFSNPACVGEENGSIIVSKFSGGKSPYSVSAMNQKNKEADLNSLHSGIYFVKITDSDNCFSTFDNIVVKEKTCEKKYEFNPFVGEKWEMPVNSVNGTLTVYDKNGNVYFSTFVSSNMQEFWAGESTQGETKTGYFLFKIDYENGVSQRGSISIVR